MASAEAILLGSALSMKLNIIYIHIISEKPGFHSDRGSLSRSGFWILENENEKWPNDIIERGEILLILGKVELDHG